ncbi:MAG: hypothetical protein KF690_02430 [Bacteroidetes bacterium]|nr:hypothetical protein [Bacteroidota bacterium]
MKQLLPILFLCCLPLGLVAQDAPTEKQDTLELRCDFIGCRVVSYITILQWGPSYFLHEGKRMVTVYADDNVAQWQLLNRAMIKKSDLLPETHVQLQLIPATWRTSFGTQDLLMFRH